MHLSLWYVVLVCHQCGDCENYVGSVYIGVYGGLSRSGHLLLVVFCGHQCKSAIKWSVLYAVLYVCVCCFVVHGCAFSKMYIDVCYCDMFSVVNVYLDHLKFCVVCINGGRYDVVVNVMLSLMSVMRPPPAL